jgi:hypothetical protein
MNVDQAVELLRAVVRRGHASIDVSGNPVCFYCGDYLTYTQPDGRRRGAHKSDCVWKRCEVLLELLDAIPAT